MLRRNLDLTIVVCAAAAGLLAQVLPAATVLRVVLAAPLLMVWPGYAAAAALFPDRLLGWVERVLFSVALSMALVILGAVMLNWSPWGLTLGVWLAYTGGVTLIASVVALRRRRGEALPAPVVWQAVSLRQWALLAAAGLLGAGALALSRAPVAISEVQGYTMLWMLPQTESARPAVRLGVQSAELDTQTYRLELTISGVTVETWDNLRLAPGQSWETTASLGTAPIANNRVELRLFRMDAPAVVYRRVSWWGQ